MLLIGLPLTGLLGTLFVVWPFPELLLREAALPGAILSPTGAALGQPVAEGASVPSVTTAPLARACARRFSPRPLTERGTL